MDYKELIEQLVKPLNVDGSYIVDHFRRDAATAITDLLARAEAAEAKTTAVMMVNKSLSDALKNAAARTDRAEREKDAAVSDLREISDCDYCKGKCDYVEIDDCDECPDKTCKCRGCDGHSNWTWRGQKEE